MGWFHKKPDPISDRARALNSEIAGLEAEIQRLNAQIQKNEAQPRLRSTAVPHAGTRVYAPHSPSVPPGAGSHDPIFEEVDLGRLTTPAESSGDSPEHFNELGVRKYDLPALLARIKNHFRGPATTNPKLVSYLAAGGIQGLRPLRYEKRVARNRFIVLVVGLFLLLLGLILAFSRHNR